MILRWLFFAAIAVGHISLWIWLFNRVNALALERRSIKWLEKAIVLVCLVLPFLLGALEWRSGAWGYSWLEVWQRVHEPDFYQRGSTATLIYSCAVLLFLLATGPRWLACRPAFAMARDRYHTLHERLEKDLHRQNPAWVTGSMARRALAIPGNEILSLETNIKRLRLEGVPPAFAGMRIGHLSDLHFMGQISPDFTRYCVDWALSQDLELLVISGDLLDDPKGLPHLREALGGLPAELPKIFVLGNHERAFDLVEDARDAMVALDWLDAGARDVWLSTPRGEIRVIGNERPWLHRHEISAPPAAAASNPGLVLGVSHSPDQLEWARAMGCHLLLCGHTHGGQIRLPWIGPVIAPSLHGSRFASGVFCRLPTVMHVSRGLAGRHPLRWGCPPEASVLEIAVSSPG